ncbi:hypothetical protein ERJ75_001571400 [Trypanosoma vivax]|nr:hypothetical protein ERJ75_001571400 [Trypanosoma vivax]
MASVSRLCPFNGSGVCASLSSCFAASCLAPSLLPGPRTRRAAVLQRLFVVPSLRVVFLSALSASYLPARSLLLSSAAKLADARVRALLCRWSPTAVLFRLSACVGGASLLQDLAALVRCVRPHLLRSARVGQVGQRPTKQASHRPLYCGLQLGTPRTSGQANATGKRRRALGFALRLVK